MAAFFRDPHLSLTWEEFWMWQAYFEMEPPSRPDDYRAAMICAKIHNSAGKSYKENITPDDILGISKPKQPKEVQTAQEQKDFLRSLRGG